MRRSVFLLALFLVLGINAAGPAWGQPADASRKHLLPDFDFRDVAAAEEPDGGQQSQAQALLERRRAGIQSFLAAEVAANLGTRITPNRFGVPKLFLREGRALSAPSTQQPEEIAKRFLQSHAAIFPFAGAEVDNLRLLIQDVARDATFLAFNQTVDGIDVFNGQIKFTLSKAGEVVEVAAGDITPGLSLSTTPRLSLEEAVRAAFRAAAAGAPATLTPFADSNGKPGFLNPRGDRFNPITVELSVFPLTASSARLAYRVFLDIDAERYYEILVDATDGSLLFRHNLYVRGAQGTVWRQSPIVGSRQLVTFPPSDDPLQTPDPWLSTSANGASNTGWVTSGNNTDTYLDATGDDQPDSTSSSCMQNGRAYSATEDFTFPFGDGTVGLDPRGYQCAAVANLFYFVNLAHDFYYSLGFTESAGNLQTDNYGRGGVGHDAVLAEAQFGGFTDNSDFSPTPEGTPPHLRMGLYTLGTTTKTDDLDADYGGQTAIHEYGHGVSNRLVGAGTSTSCLAQIQSGAMGEGWSDYFAISYFNNPVYGAYQSQNPISGLRRQSYQGYTYTYADVGNGSYGYEVHDDGEIWAATLWDLRNSLGQAVTDRLVINGLKSTPCNPSMTDARDAILAADQAANGGANRATIWQVFAKHGLGFSARGIDGSLITGTVYDAGYDQPPDLQSAKNPAITSSPLSIATSLGQSYLYQVTASNPNGGVLNYSLTSGPAGMTVNSASGSVSWAAATFASPRVEITVTDGKGGRVVHGYALPVFTSLNPGSPVTISGALNSAGFAGISVPAGVPVLQVTLRNGSGDPLLGVTAPDGNSISIVGTGTTLETLSFANPIAGNWLIEVDGYAAYSGVSLTAALITPTVLDPNTTLSGLSDVIERRNVLPRHHSTRNVCFLGLDQRRERHGGPLPEEGRAGGVRDCFFPGHLPVRRVIRRYQHIEVHPHHQPGCRRLVRRRGRLRDLQRRDVDHDHDGGGADGYRLHLDHHPPAQSALQRNHHGDGVRRPHVRVVLPQLGELPAIAGVPGDHQQHHQRERDQRHPGCRIVASLRADQRRAFGALRFVCGGRDAVVRPDDHRLLMDYHAPAQSAVQRDHHGDKLLLAHRGVVLSQFGELPATGGLAGDAQQRDQPQRNRRHPGCRFVASLRADQRRAFGAVRVVHGGAHGGADGHWLHVDYYAHLQSAVQRDDLGDKLLLAHRYMVLSQFGQLPPTGGLAGDAVQRDQHRREQCRSGHRRIVAGLRANQRRALGALHAIYGGSVGRDRRRADGHQLFLEHHADGQSAVQRDDRGHRLLLAHRGMVLSQLGQLPATGGLAGDAVQRDQHRREQCHSGHRRIVAGLRANQRRAFGALHAIHGGSVGRDGRRADGHQLFLEHHAGSQSALQRDDHGDGLLLAHRGVVLPQFGQLPATGVLAGDAQ